eukprot:UN0439
MSGLSEKLRGTCMALCRDCRHKAGRSAEFMHLLTKSDDKDCQVSHAHVATLTRELHSKRKFADAFLECEDQKLPVHRCVLATSPVFEKMLESTLVEGASSSISIKDSSARAVQQFVHLLYTGTLESDACLPEVVRMVDKYQVLHLLPPCVSKMSESVSSDNVAAYARVAKQLRHHKACRDFEGELKEMVEDDADLLNAIFDAL